MSQTSQYSLQNRIFPGIFLLVSSLMLLSVTHSAMADGVFDNRNKQQHTLSSSELTKIQKEHETRFGQSQSAGSYNTANPWERKKQQSEIASTRGSWGDCRDYALNMRNICYKQGRNAYSCERQYDARARLCDASF